MQQFNLSELSKFDGKNDPLVYLACKNTIFDVSNSGFYKLKQLILYYNLEHYKPTGSYGIFAGKDCSISLAKMSFDESFLNSSNHFTLNSKEKETLDQWYDKFKEKYPVVGILKPN